MRTRLKMTRKLRVENGRVWDCMTPVIPPAVKRHFTVRVAGEVVKVHGDPSDWVSWDFVGVNIPTCFKIVGHLEEHPEDYHILQYHKEVSR